MIKSNALRLTHLMLLSGLLVLAGCNFDVDPPEPIRLAGAKEFPTDLESLRNEYDFRWRTVARHDNGHLLTTVAGYPDERRGQMIQRYRRQQDSGSNQLSERYEVEQRYWQSNAPDFIHRHEYGFGVNENNLIWFAEDGQRLRQDTGVQLLRQQIAVGDAFTVQFDFPGSAELWTTFAEVEVLGTEMVSTRLIDIETYVIRVRGDDEDNGDFDGTDDYRFERLLWVSPEVGIVQERWSFRERPGGENYQLETLREYTLRSRP